MFYNKKDEQQFVWKEGVTDEELEEKICCRTLPALLFCALCRSESACRGDNESGTGIYGAENKGKSFDDTGRETNDQYGHPR